MWQRGLLPPIAETGNANGGFDFTYHGFYVGSMPLVSGPEPAIAETEPTLALALEVQPTVTHHAEVEFALALAAEADATATSPPAETAATEPTLALALEVQPQVTHHAEAEFVLALSAEAEPVSVDAAVTAEVEFALALGLEVEPAAVADVTAEVEFALALGMEAEAATDAATAEVEFVLALGVEAETEVVETANAAMALTLLLEVQPVVAHVAEVEFKLALGLDENYTGPGTGLVVPGQRFNVNTLREGDTFTVFLPWAGLEGQSGIAHVMSRTATDDKADQDLELSIVPHDTANVARLAGGATPVPEADSTDVARTQARQGREIDRIERTRNR